MSLKMCIHSKIGTDRYNEYLKDLFTSRYYENMVPFEDDLVKEATYGEPLWRSNIHEFTPYELLFTAVICQAVNDYMEAYIESKRYAKDSWKHGKCMSKIEEITEFMSKYDETEAIMDALTLMIRKEWNTERLAQQLRRSSNKFLGSIGAKKTRRRVAEN